MDHLLGIELIGLLIGLSCLPSWLIAKWYAAHGARLALRRSLFINGVLALVGMSLLTGALALEMRQARPLLTYAFGLLGIVGLLVSAALHAFDDD
ncbi:hypothetical protein [Duganella sp. Root1480D1]|uniref:hypothetical protein n=1 Tax=Duganella sp. Root1480D1 TaxID=1736471 RepID=UPI0007103F63|nr:hypothetical protein [Duganella sp. Root1480D1]KQZ40949.1 hypothetical protein ASD58_26645 [Duganella sp. Root1480D1]